MHSRDIHFDVSTCTAHLLSIVIELSRCGLGYGERSASGSALKTGYALKICLGLECDAHFRSHMKNICLAGPFFFGHT